MALVDILERRNLPDEQRVVATGLGTVNPLGLNVPSTVEGLQNMRNGIVRLSKVLGYLIISDVDVGGLVPNFDPLVYFPQVELGKTHRSAQLAYAASVEALIDAGFLSGIPEPKKGSGSYLINVNPERFGVHMGTGVGGSIFSADAEDFLMFQRIQEAMSTSMVKRAIFERIVTPLFIENGRFRLKRSDGTDWILDELPERVATVTAMKLGAMGSVDTVVAACATGSDNIGRLADLIRLGKLDAGIAGGTEAPIHRIGYASFNNMRALNRTHDPETASTPFDKRAAGFVMAEGAGGVVLESLAHARRRGARVYSEFMGYGHTCDAFHDTMPREDGSGNARSIRVALLEAHVNPEEIDYINDHGTSTPKGDSTEPKALLLALGEPAKKIPQSSTKSMTGHLLGGAGGLETVIVIKSMDQGFIPATRNTRDLVTEEYNIIIGEPIQQSLAIVGNNVLGFGGINHFSIWAKWPG